MEVKFLHIKSGQCDVWLMFDTNPEINKLNNSKWFRFLGIQLIKKKLVVLSSLIRNARRAPKYWKLHPINVWNSLVQLIIKLSIFTFTPMKILNWILVAKTHRLLYRHFILLERWMHQLRGSTFQKFILKKKKIVLAIPDLQKYNVISAFDKFKLCPRFFTVIL